MSDTFDHMTDAYDQYVAMGEDGECFDTPDNRTRWEGPDYLFYHRKKYYHKIVEETKKAYLIHFLCMSEPIWVPKGLCRRHNPKEQYIWVWKNTDGVVTGQTKSVIDAWKKKHNFIK